MDETDFPPTLEVDGALQGVGCLCGSKLRRTVVAARVGIRGCVNCAVGNTSARELVFLEIRS